MSPSPSSSPPTAIPTPSLHPHSLSPPKKPPPLPWTHEETLNLIRAYQQKWYSLKRGQLKASQWEEVSVNVAAFCRLDEPSKSATQCRHKIEKLRKRYRSEKQKPNPNSWIYFDLMDQLERGPLPISAVAPARPLPAAAPADYSGSDDDDDDDDYDGGMGKFGSRVSRKLGEFEKRVDGVGNFGSGFSRKLGEFEKRVDGYRKLGDFEERGGGNLARKRKFYEEEEEREREEWGDDGGGDERNCGNLNVVGELATQMREFAERFVRVERKKMEVMRENERFRMEMENKRLEMILVSQKKTVEMISKVFASSAQKKMKMTQDL